jgi:hypothetical protein
MPILSQEKARIFRITHIDNMAWAIRNGLHCRSSDIRDPNFKEIGNPEIISIRSTRGIPIVPGGSLDNYIPFYFTPFSPMLYNIKTGHNGLIKVPMEDIVILVANLPALRAGGHTWIFSDRNAALRYANFYSDVGNLGCINWTGLQARDFRRDPEAPDKFERYQAEALIHRFLPLTSLAGLVCYGPDQRKKLQLELEAGAVQLQVEARPDWYF